MKGRLSDIFSLGNRWQGLLRWMFFVFTWCNTRFLGRGSLPFSWIKVEVFSNWKIYDILKRLGSSRGHGHNNWRGQWDSVGMEGGHTNTLWDTSLWRMLHMKHGLERHTSKNADLIHVFWYECYIIHIQWKGRKYISRNNHCCIYWMIGEVLLRIAQWVRGEVLAQEGGGC